MSYPLRAAVSCAALLAAGAARADDAADPIIVTGTPLDPIGAAPVTTASIDAGRIARTINAVNVEDTLKYLPSLVIRKRHIGDTQSPIATRTSGLGASARSLVYADGAPLSALIGNNNSNASPRWSLVAPEEIERIEVLYGPFSAAYPGNSIGAVVNITTRLPERLEASAKLLTNVQSYSQYALDAVYPTYQASASAGDRFGALALRASWTRTDSRSQPLVYATAARPPAPSASGAPTSGGADDRNRTGAPIRVLGATGIEHQVQDTGKLKAALDLGGVRWAYTLGLFREDNDAGAITFLRGAAGEPVYAGSLNIGGFAYSVPASAFSSGVYHRESRHWSHALSARGAGKALDWQVIGTLYDYVRDVQRSPSGPLPGGASGGAGQIVRLDGTGWATLDASLRWRPAGSDGPAFSAGLHGDRFTLRSDRFRTTDWRAGAEGQRDLVSRGRTRTLALWGQAELPFAKDWTLTLGARQEWWRAYHGIINTALPERRTNGLSPKASVVWRLAPHWSARLSLAQAYRFPTVGELYQAVTTGATLTVPDPTLRPERARSAELAIEHGDDRGTLRLSLFGEGIRDALISQSAPLVKGSPTLYNYVQNVPRTRARGVELAIDRRDLLPRVDLQASVTYADAETRRNPVFPGSVGKRLPSVPRWKAAAVLGWRPVDALSLTAAARYASRNYATLDNSDVVGNTYQGFYRYLVADLRAQARIGERLDLAIGVDNVGNERYFLFHPFPQRSVSAEVRWRF
jgi:iron complex outermembrane receptor protein